MQVTETLNEGLKRELKVVIPAADLASRVDERLEELKATAQIKGFRPGKVPMGHLKKMYGKQAMAEVVQKSIEISTTEALNEKSLKPAYQPEVVLPEDEKEVEAVMDGKADLAFTMNFEVVPDIEITDFNKLKVEKLVVEVTDEHIDEALQNIAGQYKDWEDKGDKKAADGDRVTISFVGKIGGEAFDGGTAEEVPLELGSGSFIPGFEDQLVGAKAGDEKVVKVKFPAEYGVDTLAGKDAEFDVKVSKVEAPKATEINDEFATKLGLESAGKLKEMVKERIADEFASMTNAKLKRDMLDALDAEYKFDLPEKLVDQEFNAIWAALTREMQAEGKTFEDEDTTEEETRKEYRQIAERRVRLGLVIGTIGEKAGVTVADEELQRGLIERARQFPGQEKQVFEFYRSNPQALVEIRGPIFEQKVVEHIAEGADLTERAVSRESLQHMLEHDHEHGEACDHPDHDHGGDAKPAKKAPAKKAAKKAAKKDEE
ncbi:MAG: trigger factor [Anderseniella sp.]|nr:trigger factor [Anderseniella sp.]